MGKTGIIVTNKTPLAWNISAGNVILRVKASKGQISGVYRIPNERSESRFDFDLETIVIHKYCGWSKLMSKEDAQNMGADFGLWLCS